MNIREQFIKVWSSSYRGDTEISPQWQEEAKERARRMIDDNATEFVMFKAGVAAATSEKPTVYLSQFEMADGGKPAISVSNLSLDVDGDDSDGTWDKNKVFLVEPNRIGTGVVRTSTTITTLRNVLSNAGVIVVIES